MNLQAQAQPLLDEQRQLAGQLAKTPALKGAKALFIFNHAGMTPLIMGQGTEAQAALAQAGIENCATFNAYKQVAAEAMVSLAPDFVIVSRAGLAAQGVKTTCGNWAAWPIPRPDSIGAWCRSMTRRCSTSGRARCRPCCSYARTQERCFHEARKQRLAADTDADAGRAVRPAGGVFAGR
nr:hypothetical protein [Pseudomonas sp. BIGb0427]